MSASVSLPGVAWGRGLGFVVDGVSNAGRMAGVRVRVRGRLAVGEILPTARDGPLCYRKPVGGA